MVEIEIFLSFQGNTVSFLSISLRGIEVQFPAVISIDSLSSHFDGYAMLCSPFVEPVVIFLQHPKVPLWTTTRPNFLMPKIHTTIGLRVSFLFVCEIAVHSVSTSPEDCAFIDHEGL